MALLTQKAILATFEEMLEEIPFDKIRVSTLVRRCGVSPNTFYYNYQDIYALLDAWFKTKIAKIKGEVGEDADWKTSTKCLLHLCQDHPKITYHVLDSLSREQLENYVFTTTEDDFFKQVHLKTNGTNLSKTHVDEMTQFCKYAFLGFFIKFLWNRMDSNVDEDIDRLSVMFENFVLSEINSASETLSTYQ